MKMKKTMTIIAASLASYGTAAAQEIEKQYNVTAPQNFEGLMVQADAYMSGGFGMGISAVVWLIAYTSFADWPADEALIASTWGTTLLMSLLALLEVGGKSLISPDIPMLTGAIALGVTAWQFNS